MVTSTAAPKHPRIIKVKKNGLAARYGLGKGDRISAINGHDIGDMLDFLFYENEADLRITVNKADGLTQEWHIDKDEDEPLGLELEPLSVQSCHNHCVFCFVHQQPKGLRKSLYVKDEDFRFSFLHGSFVTLSHITDQEIEKIVRLHLSPLYVSVHATDENVRAAMLGHRVPNRILPLLNHLTEAGVTIHAQVVLCPGYNDGQVLDKTIADLSMMMPGIASLAIVPVGLTAHRHHLPELNGVSRRLAGDLIAKYAELQGTFYADYGFDWLYWADELYLLANKAFPKAKHYDDFPQIENGVGLCRQFIDGWRAFFKELAGPINPKPCQIMSGRSFAPLLAKLIRKTFKENARAITIVPVDNQFFGPTVSVTGLLTGQDIIRTCRNLKLAGPVFLPDIIFNTDRVTIDDMTLDRIEEQLKVPVRLIETNPESLATALLNDGCSDD